MNEKNRRKVAIMHLTAILIIMYRLIMLFPGAVHSDRDTIPCITPDKATYLP